MIALPKRTDLPPDYVKKPYIAPFPGPQTAFLQNPSRILITGGSVGGGKTGVGLLDSLKYRDLPNWRGTIWRRQYVDLVTPGGVFDTACDMFGKAFPSKFRVMKGSQLAIRWNSGAELSFRHLNSDGTCENYRSAQIPWMNFEELTQFTQYQFFYMMSRNRSPHGYPVRIRANTNPDSESWVAEFLSWWIDQKSGYAIPERAGAARWFIRDRSTDALKWYGSRALAIAANPDNPDFPGLEVDPISAAFIPSHITDNPILYAPGSAYVAGLSNLTEVERERLLRGNWLVVADSGDFKREWFVDKGLDSRTIDRSKFKRLVRAWDLASTPKRADNNPDYTVGALVALDDQNRAVIANIIRGRWDSGDVESQIAAACRADKIVYGPRVETVIEQEPGSSGPAWTNTIIRNLAGFPIHAVPARTNKLDRALPLATQSKAGNVYFERGGWNDDFFGELFRFPFGAHDDQVDAVSHGYQWLTENALAGWSATDYQKAYPNLRR